MKRIITIILTIIMLLSLASCGTGGSPDQSPAPTGEAGVSSSVPTAAPTEVPTLEPEEPFDRIFYFAEGQNVIGMRDTVYRLVNNGARDVVWFTDKEYRCWMPLCGRPDCMHRSADCNAWLEGGALCGIEEYGGYIWYVVDPAHYVGEYVPDEDDYPQLWRMKLDGTEHELVLKLIPPIALAADRGESFGFLTMGHFILMNFVYDNNTTNERRRILYCIDLSSDEPVMSELHFALTLPVASDGAVFYGMLPTDDREGTKIFRFDPANDFCEEICTVPQPYNVSGAELIGDTLYLAFVETGSIVRVDVNTGSFSGKHGVLPVKSFEFGTDELHLFRWLECVIYSGLIFVTDKSDEEIPTATLIYDLDGNLITRLDFTDDDTPIEVGSCVGNIVFGYAADSEVAAWKRTPEWYLDLNEMGTDNFGWKKWEP